VAVRVGRCRHGDRGARGTRATCASGCGPLRWIGCGYLDDLYVEPSVRGSGAVEALYAEMNRIARERGWAIIRWTTADDNYRAPQRLRQGRDAHDLDHLRHDSVSVQRYAARVLLLDEAGRVLLFRGGDPHRPEAGTWWFTPCGGLDAGETVEDAGAARGARGDRPW